MTSHRGTAARSAFGEAALRTARGRRYDPCLHVTTLQRQAIVRARRFSGPIRNSRFESIIVNAGRMAPPDKPMRFIDIGANLLDKMYSGVYHDKTCHEPDAAAVLQRAWNAGVEKIIITAGTLQEAKDALEFSQRDHRLFCTVGVHPTRCGEFESHPEGPEAYFQELGKVLKAGQASGKIVAIGECGLDYDRLQFCDKDTQKKYFALQFALARESGLPMFLHMRAAASDFTEILKQNITAFSGGVVHSFDGSTQEAHDLMRLHPKVFIGINGCSLKTAENCEVMSCLPLARLMIETDAPWCDVRPTHAGYEYVKTKWETKDKKKYDAACLVKGRNEPCSVVQVLEVVAGFRGLSNTWAVSEMIYKITEGLFFPPAAAVDPVPPCPETS